jgi:hypothetical protein
MDFSLAIKSWRPLSLLNRSASEALPPGAKWPEREAVTQLHILPKFVMHMYVSLHDVVCTNRGNFTFTQRCKIPGNFESWEETGKRNWGKTNILHFRNRKVNITLRIEERNILENV